MGERAESWLKFILALKKGKTKWFHTYWICLLDRKSEKKQENFELKPALLRIFRRS